MKQRQVKTPSKNARKNAAPKKVVPTATVEEIEDEEVVEEKPASEVQNNEKVTEALEAMEDNEVEPDGGEEDEEPMEEDEDEDDIDEDEELEDLSEDEVINPRKRKATIPSQVQGGKIPDSVPLTNIIHAKQLPKKCKQIYIVEAFAPYGPIDYIHIFSTRPGRAANIAFKHAHSAAAALADNTIKVNDCLVEVGPKYYIDEKFDINASRERSVYVKCLRKDTTEEQVKEHFASCGEIERCKVISKNSVSFAFVTFTDKESVTAAKKLHNSVLNDATIGVYENTPGSSRMGDRDAKLTIMLKNKQKHECIDGKLLEKIFENCEIDNMDVLCMKNILAFISFKSEEDVKKAMELNGKILENIHLEMEQYNPEKRQKTSIYVTNLPKDCTSEDLRNLFSKTGEILSIALKKGSAIIRFKEVDAFCKSFLLDESYIKNQIIFLEPYSLRKQNMMKTKMSKLLKHKKGRKRTVHNGNNGNNVFVSKNPKKQRIE